MIDQVDLTRVIEKAPRCTIAVLTVVGNLALSQQLMEMLGVRP